MIKWRLTFGWRLKLHCTYTRLGLSQVWLPSGSPGKNDDTNQFCMMDPIYYSPYYTDPQNHTSNFWKALYARSGSPTWKVPALHGFRAVGI